MDASVFVGSGNEQAHITATRASGRLWPKIRLYDPNGVLVAEQSDLREVQVVQILPVSGTYTILVSDGFNATLTGGYSLSLSK